MPSKKISKKPAAKKVVKGGPARAKKKSSVMEQALEAMMEHRPAAVKSAPRPTGTHRRRFSGWGILSLVLALAFGGILLYEHNPTFRSKATQLVNSTGLLQLSGGAQEKKDPFVMKLTIVYNASEPTMKSILDNYVANIEKNLENTKVAANWLDKNDAQAQEIIAKLDAKYLPIFVTDASIQSHPLYAQFSQAVSMVNGEYVFQSEGMEYLKVPEAGDARVLGAKPDKAKVHITEYASMSCGYCKMMHPILQTVLKKYAKDVSLAVKHYDRGGSDSLTAQATECAADLGRFDQMVTAMYNHQSDIASAGGGTGQDNEALYAQIKVAAREAGVNGDRVVSCVKSGKYAEKVAKHTEEGRVFGVMGTPSFFINNKFIGGAVDEIKFTSFIEEALNK